MTLVIKIQLRSVSVHCRVERARERWMPDQISCSIVHGWRTLKNPRARAAYLIRGGGRSSRLLRAHVRRGRIPDQCRKPAAKVRGQRRRDGNAIRGRRDVFLFTRRSTRRFVFV